MLRGPFGDPSKFEGRLTAVTRLIFHVFIVLSDCFV